LYHEELETNDEGNGQPEVNVDLGEDSLEHVDFALSNLPAVEVVEDLREYERAENVSEHFKFHLSAPVW